MPVHNNDVAAIFDEIADLLEIEGANVFRVRAYRNAARLLRGLGTEVRVLLEQGEDLADLPGVGKDLAAKIAEIVDTGTARMLGELHKEVPAGLADLLKIPGLGPKRVRALFHELDVQTAEQLERAAKDGRVRSLPGFSAKSEQRILQALERRVTASARFKLAATAPYVDTLLDYLKRVPGVKRAEVAGSFRRALETVGDIDILVTASKGSPVMARFAAFEDVREVVASGTTRATVILRSGLQVDLRVVPAASYGAALHYFTGSKAHNIAIRRLGQQVGLKINEYGVFRGDRRIAGKTEESVFRSVGLPFIPPELRENRGEIEAAREGRLPELVNVGDLRGDLHAHTAATDGHNTIGEMAEAAREHGFEYMAVTEHSRRLTMVHGLDPARLARQIDEIDRLNAEGPGLVILKGIEVDILENGRLDLPDRVLSRLDLVVGAVHSRFHLSRTKQTERILRAMERPHFTILAHPSGRLIDKREPYDVDMPRIIRAARARGCHIELNAHPERLDLLDIYCQIAKSEGVLVSINSDAHSTRDFDNLRFGVGQARRGWLAKDDVLNTRPLSRLRPLLARTM